MSPEGMAHPLLDTLIGAELIKAEKQDRIWVFRFSNGTILSTESLWRFSGPAGVCTSSEDDGHRFGLPAPVDAAAVTLREARPSKVVRVSLSRVGDLQVEFSGDRCLELLQLSSGYESWRFLHQERELICLGGGKAFFAR